MAWSGKKIRVYAKLIIIAMVLLAVLAFILSNRHTVTVKFLWMETPAFPLWLFTIFACLAGVLIFWIVRRIRGVFNEMHQVRREEQTRSKLVKDIKSELGQQKSKEQGESQ